MPTQTPHPTIPGAYLLWPTPAQQRAARIAETQRPRIEQRRPTRAASTTSSAPAHVLAYRAPSAPAPVRPAEGVISATIEHADGPRLAVLLTSRPVRLVTGRFAAAVPLHTSTAPQYPSALLASRAPALPTAPPAGAMIADDTATGRPTRYALAPGRIVLARRDALSLSAWRRTLAGEE